MFRCAPANDQWQPEHDDDEQPPQPELPEPDEDEPDDLPMPKRDRSFSVRSEPHTSHTTCGLDPKTSFSKSAPQALQ